jgi:hypothetical protein
MPGAEAGLPLFTPPGDGVEVPTAGTGRATPTPVQLAVQQDAAPPGCASSERALGPLRASEQQRLDEACLQGQPGEVGAAPAPGFVADAVQVGADGADADVQLPGDLGVGAALCHQGD